VLKVAVSQQKEISKEVVGALHVCQNARGIPYKLLSLAGNFIEIESH
jgi:hypothetical protein